jgi:hypothetical protein
LVVAQVQENQFFKIPDLARHGGELVCCENETLEFAKIADLGWQRLQSAVLNGQPLQVMQTADLGRQRFHEPPGDLQFLGARPSRLGDERQDLCIPRHRSPLFLPHR